MPHFDSKKLKGSHHTAIEVALPILGVADRCSTVSGIKLCHIINKSGGNPRLDMDDDDAGLKCKVRGNNEIQEIIIFTTDREAVKIALAEVAPNGRGKRRKKPKRS